MAHKRSPIRKCVSCLYRAGLGVHRIEAIVKKSKSLCFRWVKQDGILDPQRAKRGSERAVKNAKMTFSDRLIMEGYARDIKLAKRNELLWRGGFKKRKPLTFEQKNRRRERMKSKRLNDPIFRAVFYSRKRVKQYLKSHRIKKRSSIRQFVGCSPIELKKHIESQFQSGMNWSNHGTFWEIDHIVPLASASDFDSVMKLTHYTNLQPLTKADNRAKSDSMPRNHQTSLLLAA